MTLVTASIEIDAPPERVYDMMLDPAHLDEWVTIHRRINHTDDAAEAFGVRLHSFEAAVERALREWESTEEVAAK